MASKNNDYVSTKAVIEMAEKGINGREIASRLGCRLGQVLYILANFKDRGNFEKRYGELCEFAFRAMNYAPLKKAGNMERLGITKEATYRMFVKMCHKITDFQSITNMFYQHLKHLGASEEDLETVWEIFKKYADNE